MLATLNHHLVTTLGASGDVVRNIMCCPAPLGDRQRADVGAYAQEAARRFRADVGAYAQEAARRFRPRTQAYYELRLDGERAVTAKAPGEEPLYGTTYLPRIVQDRLRVLALAAALGRSPRRLWAAESVAEGSAPEVPFRAYRTRSHNVHQRATLTPCGSATLRASEMPSSANRSTDQALCERLSFVAAGEQITDIVKTLLNC